MLRSAALLTALATFLSGGCASVSATKVHFDAIGEYSVEKASPLVLATSSEVRVFYGSAPEGFSYQNDTLSVEPGYRHKILGTVRVLWSGDKTCFSTRDTMGNETVALTKRDVIERMKEAASLQGGNAVVLATSKIPEAPDEDELCDLVNRYKNEIGTGWIVALAPRLEPEGPAPVVTERRAPTRRVATR